MCEAIRRFRNLLEKVAAGKLELHSSLKKGKLGFYWNEYCADRSGLVMCQGKEGRYWVGLQYSLWCANKRFATWLYNEKGKYVVTTMEAVNSTGALVAIQDGPNHVSVIPTNPLTMKDWIESRPNAEVNPHQYTNIMK